MIPQSKQSSQSLQSDRYDNIIRIVEREKETYLSQYEQIKKISVNDNSEEKVKYISKLKGDVEFYQLIIDSLTEAKENQSSPSGLIQYLANKNGGAKLKVKKKIKPPAILSRKREPKDMLRPEFKEIYRSNQNFNDKKDLIDLCFARHGDCLSINQIAKLMYETKTDSEFKRVKDALSQVLYKGINEKRWQRIERGYFAINSFQLDEEKSDQLSATQSNITWATSKFAQG